MLGGSEEVPLKTAYGPILRHRTISLSSLSEANMAWGPTVSSLPRPSTWTVLRTLLGAYAAGACFGMVCDGAVFAVLLSRSDYRSNTDPGINSSLSCTALNIVSHCSGIFIFKVL